MSTPPISSSTATGLSISGGGSSKVGAIAGGIVGGIAAFAIVIAAIFYLRRNSQAPSAGVGAPQPLRPLSVEGVPSLPTTIKSYVRSFVPCVSLVCYHVSPFSYFCTFSTRITQLRSRTKVDRIRTRSLIKDLCHYTTGLEAPWATLRPRCPGPGDMTVVPFSDLALRNHQESGMNSICLPSSKCPLFCLGSRDVFYSF